MKFCVKQRIILLLPPSVVIAVMFVASKNSLVQFFSPIMVAFLAIYLCFIVWFVYHNYLHREIFFFSPSNQQINKSSIFIVVNIFILLSMGFLFINDTYHRYQYLLTKGEQLYLSACDINNDREVASRRFSNQLMIQRHIRSISNDWFVGLQRYYVTGGHSKPFELQQRLWNCYVDLNQRNLIQPLSEKLQQQLSIYVRPGVSLINKMQMFESSYEQLMAYKMMAEPSKVNSRFLVTLLTDDRLRPDTIPLEQWHNQSVELVTFYVYNLINNDDWAIELNNDLIDKVRLSLIHDINLHNSETAVYQRILKQAAQNYDDLSLNRLLNDVDSQMLFVSLMDVPGMFTRQAWEGVIENEINQHMITSYPDIHWVIGEESMKTLILIPQDQLRMTLIYRYNRDYDAAWHYFLNNLRWRKAETVEESIDQLALLSEPIKSPFIALMKAIRYQGEISYNSDPSVKTGIENDQETEHLPRKIRLFTENSGFGNLIKLFNIDGEKKALLQSYLDYVTMSRDKLKAISSSSDPVIVARAMSNMGYQNINNQVIDSSKYGKQLTELFGNEWDQFSNNIFIQPVEQSWQSLLDPLIEQVNQRWQALIADPWNGGLAFYYPLKKTNKDAPIDELYQMLRPMTGTIEQFVLSELSSVMEQKNGSWTAKPLDTDRLRFHPKFLPAMNTIGQITASLPLGNENDMLFVLTGRISKDVRRTELIINEQTAIGSYHNTSYDIAWPTDYKFPQTELKWTTDFGGERNYDDIRGSMSFIRLLEKAKIRNLDNHRYLISWKASDGNLIEFELVTKRGKGPLAFLLLKGLTLPPVVFEPLDKTS